jgi:hypothetical protein
MRLDQLQRRSAPGSELQGGRNIRRLSKTAPQHRCAIQSQQKNRR